MSLIYLIYIPEIPHDYTVEEILEPKTFTQDELNELVRDLVLSKEKSEHFASRLKQKHLLNKKILICHYRSRNFQLATLFKVDGPLCYYDDIIGLYTNLSQIHIASEWRLFMDSSHPNLKGVSCIMGLLSHAFQLPTLSI